MTKVPFSNPTPIRLTKRQAEALWAARETGAVYNLRGNRMGGAQERMLQSLADHDLLVWRKSRLGQGDRSDGDWGSITPTGLAELALWEQTHPKTKLNPRVNGGKR